MSEGRAKFLDFLGRKGLNDLANISVSTGSISVVCVDKIK